MIVAQEKVKAVKAEIRAIQKLDLAKEVYAQKMEEQRRLQEVILLAYQRMGEITREMPTAQGARTDVELNRVSATKLEKPKKQAIQDLGFSKDQVSRMERMAAHPDIVEAVIAESQAGQTEATQGEVLRRIKEREQESECIIDMAQERKKRFDRDMAQIDEEHKIHRAFIDAVYAPQKLPDSSTVVSAIMGATRGRPAADLDNLSLAIQKLQAIQILLRKEAHRCGKKSDP